MSIKTGSLYQVFLEGMSVGVALLAAGSFALCQKVRPKLNGKVLGFVTGISKASFCIYLVHVFVIYCFGHFHITVDILPPLISIPLLSCLNMILSYIVYRILVKLPIINRWIV